MTINNYKFSDLSNNVQEDMGLILGKITHHIHPDIIEFITKENISYKERFNAICHDLCDIDSFFYSGSDCVFPGFRRPINKEKIGKWKNNIYKEDGTILNDNTFPRHIWAYLSMNKAYSGGASGMWKSSGLDKFELAHIFSHKQDERHLEKSAFSEFNDKQEPYGLFTSASNIVLIPKGYAKPTDCMPLIKQCFYQRHLDLYGNNIIGLNDFNNNIPSWYSNIEWLEPVLPVDWEIKINNLLKYREKYLKNKYA